MSDHSSDSTILPCGHEVLHKDQVHYCDYISLNALSGLFVPFAGTAKERAFLHPDEHQFLLIHQAIECMFAQAYFDLKRTVGFVQEDEIAQADHALHRTIEWMKAIPKFMSVLKTMRPEDFAVFRMQLAPASGAESIMYRRLEILCGLKPDSPFVRECEHDASGNVLLQERLYTYRAFLDRNLGEGEFEPKTRWWTEELTQLAECPSLASTFKDFLARQRMTYADLYAQVLAMKEPAPDPEQTSGVAPVVRPLAQFLNRLFELELIFRSFRSGHSAVAKSQIGTKPGTGHTSGYPYLRSVHDTAKFFPEICALYEPTQDP